MSHNILSQKWYKIFLTQKGGIYDSDNSWINKYQEYIQLSTKIKQTSTDDKYLILIKKIRKNGKIRNLAKTRDFSKSLNLLVITHSNLI